jgi:hypothetical protein
MHLSAPGDGSQQYHHSIQLSCTTIARNGDRLPAVPKFCLFSVRTTDIKEPSVNLDILLPFNALKGLVQKIPDVNITFKGIQQRSVKAFGE